MDQNSGDIISGLSFESLYDDIAGFQFVLTADFFGSHLAGAGNPAVEIVTVGGAVGRYAPPCLGPAGCPPGMGVDNTADVGKCIVQRHMGRGIGRGLPLTFHPFAGSEADNDHVFRLHVVVFHTRGLDDHQTLSPIDSGYITPGEGHKAVFRQLQISLAYSFFQFFQHKSSYSASTALRSTSSNVV